MNTIRDLLLIIVGGAIGVLSNLMLDIWRESGKKRKAKSNILSEISVNIQSLEGEEYLHLQWQIYELYLDFLTVFKEKQPDAIIRFYSKIKRHKFLGDEYRKHKDDPSYQLSLEGESEYKKLQDDKDIIIKLGKEILLVEGKISK